MKHIALILSAIVTVANATDVVPDSIKPQQYDSQYDLMVKQTSGMSRSAVAASVEWTRTNTVTAYTSGDCVSTNETTDTKCFPFCFTNVVPATGGGIVMKVRLSSSYGAGAMPASELWLFSSTNVFLQNDNVAFQLRWTNNAARLGYVSIPNLTTHTGNDATYGLQSGMNADARLAFNIGDSVLTNKNLYGFLVIKGAYTPAASEKFELKIVVLGQ